MLDSLPMQVEVVVQDYFNGSTDNGSTEETEKGSGTESAVHSPISSEIWEAWFHHWLEQLHPTLSPNQAYELSLRLTDDAEIQVFNAQYRHKNQPTDVLAFAALEIDYPQLGEATADQPLYLGDIVISVETAQVQAQQQGHSLKQELAWLAAHGLLHLLGWDHPDEESLQRMLLQQETLLQTVGLTTHYAEVSHDDQTEQSGKITKQQQLQGQNAKTQPMD